MLYFGTEKTDIMVENDVLDFFRGNYQINNIDNIYTISKNQNGNYQINESLTIVRARQVV